MEGRDPDCKVIMTGAGGGCCGESNPYGFSAVHLTDDGRMETTYNVAPIWRNQCHWSNYEENLESWTERLKDLEEEIEEIEELW